jgi:hypothetical protein
MRALSKLLFRETVISPLEVSLPLSSLRGNLSPRQGEHQQLLSHDDVIRSTSESLKKLQTDEYVDPLLIHWPNPIVPLGETLGAMSKLQEEGSVRHIGVSNFPPSMVEDAYVAFHVYPCYALNRCKKYRNGTQMLIRRITRLYGRGHPAYDLFAIRWSQVDRSMKNGRVAYRRIFQVR